MEVPAGLDIDTLKLSTINARGVEKEITFTKNGNIIEFSNTIRVFRLVSDPVIMGISITEPTKTVYEVGDAFDKAGLTVSKNMSNGEAVVLNEGDYTMDAIDMTTAGQKVININYQGYNASFVITVNEKAPEPTSSNPIEPSSQPVQPSSQPAPSSEPVAPSSEPVSPSSQPASSSSQQGEKKAGCGGSIVATSSLMLAVSAIGFAFVSLKKKRNK